MESNPENSVPKFGVGSIVRHVSFGAGRVVGYENDCHVVLFKGGEVKKVAYDFEGMTAEETVGDPETDRIKQAVREVLGDYGWIDTNIELGKRWIGGTIKLIPGQADTQPKDIPLEAFFKKIIGVREKLRVLEQKINNHPALTDEDKLELEGYITRSYGSLTSFNVLFASKESYFKGQGKGE
jgi:hypothetical protein